MRIPARKTKALSVIGSERLMGGVLLNAPLPVAPLVMRPGRYRSDEQSGVIGGTNLYFPYPNFERRVKTPPLKLPFGPDCFKLNPDEEIKGSSYISSSGFLKLKG
jgi:hypothetical protein